MGDNFFYVYALKDPRSSPAMPFYIGKGTGSRAFDHLVNPDKTRKSRRIKNIKNDGHEPLVDVLVDNLTESQALRIEAELIGAFGTMETGGPLTNSVVPTGLSTTQSSRLVIPHGTVERAQLGLQFLKKAVTELVSANREGLTNSEVARALGLRSDYRGRQKDYLSYSILGLLLREGTVSREENSRRHRGR